MTTPNTDHRLDLETPPENYAAEIIKLTAAYLRGAGWDLLDLRDDGHTLTIIATRPRPHNHQADVALRDLDETQLGPIPQRNG